jgi:predicted phage terminase large subunit-like protein
LSETERQNVNNWYDHTLLSRLNDKKNGCIILIMQRLHEDDLVGHVLEQEDWKVLRFPAIAQEDEAFTIETPYGKRTFHRREGEALHPEREDLITLDRLRRVLNEYNFAGQYQQSPAPLEGGLIKEGWFKSYTEESKPAQFDLIFQSWDTANKPGELNDYSVCTTWGIKDRNLYLLHVFRRRMDYPTLKTAVMQQAQMWSAETIVIEDKASGTQLIQELMRAGIHGATRFEPKEEKTMRMNSCSSTIENGFVYIPKDAEWLAAFMHELKTFPNGKHDDQVDSLSQALAWVRLRLFGGAGLYWWMKEIHEKG